MNVIFLIFSVLIFGALAVTQFLSYAEKALLRRHPRILQLHHSPPLHPLLLGQLRITQYYNITQYYDRDLIPGGTSQLQIDEPSSVTTNVWARAANNTQLQMGPWNTSQVINLPVWGLDSLEIVTQVPYSPSLDGESVYVQINPVPAPLAPPPPVPASPPRPLFPPLPPFPLNATAAVADVVALEYIPSQQALLDMLNTSTASKSASIVDYLLIMPIFFSDFTIVPDCTASSQQALLRNVSSALNTTVSSFN
ncbi:hypothetical protein CEUSTIGMA_g5891.t1 [Chlamydomonas eustigma]|uniref:Uncharacterized protein n=1 Tax=Chlamydomonas eustigma TaxID=1157962 RepID=A0A250X5U4_9CHLO|nr:hypothetical protein CEUSTIGMA_g5891.t1 [Chlamydomonas eustigma]|eukprot:GAX78451.1 hypothetical protein CEUSTIGMA_g5891.t1 [Chlamydomonas eustigma]